MLQAAMPRTHTYAQTYSPPNFSLLSYAPPPPPAWLNTPTLHQLMQLTQ